MTPAGVYDLLQLSAPHDVDQLMRNSWTDNGCKDLVVFAMNLKPLPATAAHCTQVLEEQKQKGKGGSCMRVPFYVLGVTKPSSGFGWSKVPFKGTQVIKDKESLYTEESDGVRVWSFEKLSNPMHKGNRAPIEQSFILPVNSVLSFFLRPDFWEEDPKTRVSCVKCAPSFLDATGAEIPAMTPMLLSVSCVNQEQVMNGYGLKLRELQAVSKDVLSGFVSQFKTKEQLQDMNKQFEEQKKAREIDKQTGPLDKTLDTNMINRTPTLLQLDSKKAFVVATGDSEQLEIIASGLPSDAASNLWLPKQELLRSLCTKSLKRALRLIEIAISHGGVQCLVYTQFERKAMGEPGEVNARVVYLHVDWNKVLWLDKLKVTKLADIPTTLPCSDNLKMCWGQPIMVDDDLPVSQKMLQWYDPQCSVIRSTKEGELKHTFIVWELDPRQTQGPGEPTDDTRFMMDGAGGSCQTLRAFEIDAPLFEEDCGFGLSTNPKKVLTWQLRTGSVHHCELSGAQSTQLVKRPFNPSESEEDE